MFGPSKKKFEIETSGPKFELELKTKITGEDLIKSVGVHQKSQENTFYSLSYMDKHKRKRMVRPMKKIPRVDHFKYDLVYYPEAVEENMFEDHTRNELYLQVKEMIFSGEIFCSPVIATRLAGLAAHCDFGPYSENYQNGTINPTKYLPGRVLEQLTGSMEQLENLIVEQYKSFCDYCKEDVILEYLKIVEELDMFGVTFYEVRNKKNTEIWIGIQPTGVAIYDYDDKIEPKTLFSWSELKRVSSPRKNVKLLVKEEGKTKPFVFAAKSTIESREIADLCYVYSRLYNKRRIQDSDEIKKLKKFAEERDNKRVIEREEKRKARLALLKKDMRSGGTDAPAPEEAEKIEIEADKLSVESNKESSIPMDHKQIDSSMKDLKLEESHQESSEPSESPPKDLEYEEQPPKDSVMEETPPTPTSPTEVPSVDSDESDSSSSTESIPPSKPPQELPIDSTSSTSTSTQSTPQVESMITDLDNDHDDAGESYDLDHGREVDTSLEDSRQAMADLNAEYANKLKILEEELQKITDKSKWDKFDKIYNDRSKNKMDRFKTLRNIKKGSAKARIDMFESM